MAKRRHSKKRHHKRRRHSAMSGIKGNIGFIASSVAGAVIGKMVQSKLSDKVNPKILAGGQIALGLFLPKFIKSDIGKGLGTGMIVNGGVTMLQEFNVLSGLGAYDMTYIDDSMSGYDNLNTIAGDDNLSILAGDDMDDMGFTDEGIMSGDDDYDY
jgi:hypothetical protein